MTVARHRADGAAPLRMRLAAELGRLGHEVFVHASDDAFAPMLFFPLSVSRRVRELTGSLDIVDASAADAWLLAGLDPPEMGPALVVRALGGTGSRRQERMLRSADGALFPTAAARDRAVARLGIEPDRAHVVDDTAFDVAERTLELYERARERFEAFADAWRVAAEVEGWLTPAQARALFEAAHSVPPDRAIVEIGSHRGRSTIVLARGKREGVPMVAVDPFDDLRWGGGAESYEVFCDNLRAAGVENVVTPFRGTSAQAAAQWTGGTVGLVYIDGAHDRDSVLADLDGWMPMLGMGGLLCVHDAFSSPGVTAALLQRHLLNRSFRYAGSVRSLAIFRRGPLSWAEGAGSSIRLLTRTPWFTRNVLIKVALRRGWSWLPPLLGHAREEYPY